MSIEIPRNVAAAEGVPDDLDSGLVGPYRFPSPQRRRTAAVVYVVGAGLAAAGAAAGLPAGLWAVAVGLLILAGYHVVAAWPIAVGEEHALSVASRVVSFPVGHASAAIRFEGLRAKPTWNVILYGAEDPPARRGLVRIDATTGDLRSEPYEEGLPLP
jgi:hypothetical protein